MRASILTTLGLGLLGACATKSAVERASPSPPAGSETIRLLHADAHDVARELNDLIIASFWKSMPPSCALPLPPNDIFKALSTRPPEAENLRGSEEQRGVREMDPDEQVRLYAEFSAEGLRWHLERPPVTVAGPHVLPPPPTFLPWDSRTLVVLEAHRDPDYFARVSELVHRLDEDRAD